MSKPRTRSGKTEVSDATGEGRAAAPPAKRRRRIPKKQQVQQDLGIALALATDEADVHSEPIREEEEGNASVSEASSDTTVGATPATKANTSSPPSSTSDTGSGSDAPAKKRTPAEVTRAKFEFDKEVQEHLRGLQQAEKGRL